VIRMMPDRGVLTKGDNLPRADPEPASRHQILGQVVLVLRGDRVIRLTGGPLALAAKWIALLSRRNLTPAILATRVKDLLGMKR
jgi:hypothetical protein